MSEEVSIMAGEIVNESLDDYMTTEGIVRSAIEYTSLSDEEKKDKRNDQC